MKKIFKYKIQLFTLVCILGGLLFLSSCEEEEGSAEVILLSFGPSGVHHGDEITFFGQNLDKVSSIVFQPAIEVPKSSFRSVTNNRINVIVPETAEAGKVILKTPQGNVESITILNFDVPVEIESITPEEVKPGELLTITGDKLNWIERITFPSDLVLTKEDFESLTLTQLVVRVPMEAQTGFVLFATGGTKPLTFGSEEQLVVTVPAVTNFAPASIKHTENLTITGTNLDLITSVVFSGGATVQKSGFVSQSQTQIVLAVPSSTVKGKLTLKQASPIDVVTDNELTIILPVGNSISPTPAVPDVDVVTITGTNLDLVAKLILPGHGDLPRSQFDAATNATQIVFALPATASTGAVAYQTIHGYSANLGVTLRVPAPGPPALSIPVYDEAILLGGGNWSWDGTSVVASDEQIYSGDVSWKFTTTAGGGLSAGGMTPTDVTSQGSFIFALYGGDLGAASSVNVAAILNDNWGNYNAVQLIPGQWIEYEIPLTSYPGVNLTQFSRFALKVEGINSSTIYADYVGFDAKTVAAPLTQTVFSSALADGLTTGGWGEDYTDYANTEVYRRGSDPFSIKVDFPGGWSGGGQIVAADDNISLDGVTKFVFSIYGGEGSEGKQIQVNLKVDTDNPKTVTLQAGKWVDVEIPITDFAAISEFREIWFQDRGDAVTVWIDNIGFR